MPVGIPAVAIPIPKRVPGALVEGPAPEYAPAAVDDRRAHGRQSLRGQFGAGVRGAGLANLEHTHEDVSGFLGYVSRFNQPNFRITDGDVAQWRFDPVFDDAQGWRGTDSVKVVLPRRPRRRRRPERVYEAPMGSVWATRMSAFSDAMRLGDQKLRYLFLSTCESVRTTRR